MQPIYLCKEKVTVFEEKCLEDAEQGVPYHRMMTMLGGKENFDAAKALGDIWSMEVNGKTMWYMPTTTKSRKVGYIDSSTTNMGSKKIDGATVHDF